MKPAIYLLVCFAAFNPPASFASAGDAVPAREEERVCSRIEAVLTSGDYLVFKTDTVLSEGSTGDAGSLICIGCNVSVDCTVRGSVIMSGGELGLRSGTRVEGDVILLGGRMFKSRKATVAGELLKTSSDRCLRMLRESLKLKRGGGGLPLSAEMQLNRLGGFALEGYDRVDGYSVSWGFNLVRPQHPGAPLLKARTITATTRQAFGFEAVLQWPFDKAASYNLGFGVRSLTDTNDRWRLDDLDNAVKAFFAGRDLRYYFRREGYTIFFHRSLGKKSRLGIAYQNERYYSLADKSPFTLFGQENFQPNLPVDPGSIRSFLLECLIDTRNDLLFTSSGLWLRVESELAGGELGGEYRFCRLDMSIKRWDTFGRRHHTFFWFKGAFADRALPFQRGYTLGNTLRGYDNFAFSGDRMLLFQGFYGFSMPRLPLLDRLFFHWRAEAVYEAGIAFFKDDPELGYGTLKSDLGGGICGETLIGRFGIYLFRNLDEPSGAGPRVSVCLNMNVTGRR
ncbi:MAG: BamA/TamA family outer membrane protein [Candidatus Glassbacteria bacterium]|nr:BamA/TamA family outer membrane protein [Candidatus Glassbacteria bacterium]